VLPVYGNHIVRFFSRYYKHAIAILITLAAMGGMLSPLQYPRKKYIAQRYARTLPPVWT
jgi:hypothetical protein